MTDRGVPNVRVVRPRPDPMSRIEVLRRPPAAVRPGIAPGRPGSSSDPPPPAEITVDGARPADRPGGWVPGGGRQTVAGEIGIDRSGTDQISRPGRHRRAEAATQHPVGPTPAATGAVSDDDPSSTAGAVVPAAEGPRPAGPVIESAVVGGWVPVAVRGARSHPTMEVQDVGIFHDVDDHVDIDVADDVSGDVDDHLDDVPTAGHHPPEPAPVAEIMDGDPFVIGNQRSDPDGDEFQHDEFQHDKFQHDEFQDAPGEPDPATTEPGIRPSRLGRRWGRFAELWVPEPLRDARVDPGRRGALILLLVAALAAVATAVGVWRDRPEPRPVETSTLSALAVTGTSAPTGPASPTIGAGSTAGPSADPSGTGGSVAAAAPAEITVSVTGLVAKPGLVTLPAGARVADAITAAGGAGADADLTGTNLAARLSDGDSVVIGNSSGAAGAGSAVSGGGTGAAAPAAGGAGSKTGSDLVNLNTADEAALDTLPGVGPVMAQNILAWRQTNGRFTKVEQLQEISGIGPARYAQISALVTVC